jgi:NAD(P)H dehydrogenase (quinone)
VSTNIDFQGGYQGKMAAIFVSTASQHGGQETTAFTCLTTLAHHGMIFVPLGYAPANAQLTQMDEVCNFLSRIAVNLLIQVCGGSAYGAGTFAGPDGSRRPTVCLKQLSETDDTIF